MSISDSSDCGDKKKTPLPLWRKSLVRIGFVTTAVMILSSVLILGDPSGWIFVGAAPLLLPLVWGSRNIRLMTILMIASVVVMGISIYKMEQQRREKNNSMLVKRVILAGYDAMMVSDYDVLLGMTTEDIKLHAVDGSIVDREKLISLAQKAKDLWSGTRKDEALSAFLTKREAWAKRAKETTEFQSVVIKDDTATVTTLDRGTPGKLETSVYTLRKTSNGWKLRQEISSQQDKK